MKFSTLATASISLMLSCESNAFSTAPSSPIKHQIRSSITALNMKSTSTSLQSASILEDPQTLAAAVEEIPAPKTYLDDGFVFGMEGSGLTRPKGKVAQVVVEGDTLETQPYQVAAVSATMISHALFVAVAISQLNVLTGGNTFVTALETIFTIGSSWVLADLGSGVLHWSVDNYGNGRTPIMGGIIAAFQGHHTAPWTITQRGFCNNVFKLCIPFGVPTVALIGAIAGPSHPLVTMFFAVFCALEIMSQEFHKWSHTTKSQVSPIVNKLQKWGIAIGRAPHALHHNAPYDGNYCIVSGFCNSFLDKYGVFRMFEHAVYSINGVESNSWKLDPELRARTLRGEYLQIEKGRKSKNSRKIEKRQ
jgi:hypothetical protein